MHGTTNINCIICFYKLKFMGFYISVLIWHPADANKSQNQSVCRHTNHWNHLTDTRKQTWRCKPYAGASSFGWLLSHNFVSHSNLFMLLLAFLSHYKCKWIGHIQYKDQSRGHRSICFFLNNVVLLQIQKTVQIWTVNRCHGKFSYN